MVRKINLVIAVLFMLFVLIANAAEDQMNETYDSSNEDSSYDTKTLELKESSGAELAVDPSIPSSIVETNENAVSSENTVTASFGVYLTIVG